MKTELSTSYRNNLVMKFTQILFTLSLFIFISCKGQSEQKIEVLTPKAFSEILNSTPNAQLIDVRTPEEYTSAHLDNATNINWNDNDFTNKISSYDKSKPIFVYCLSGGRSQKAAEKLSELGFTTIYNLEGGITKWNAEGFGKPLDKVVGMTKAEYLQLIKKSNKKVLVDFYAKWCEPCKKMEPYLTKMTKDSSSMVVIRIDVDENKTLVSELKIDQLPTLILYNPNSEEQWRHFGYISESDLKKQL